MINRMKLFFSNEKILFNENKIKYIFSTIIIISIGLLSFMLPGLSYTSLHKVPLLFAGLLSLMIIVYLFLYQKIFIDKYIISMLLFCFVILISSLINDPRQIGQTEFLLTALFIMLYEFMSAKEHKNKSIYSIYLGLCLFVLYFFVSYFKEIISLDIGRLGRLFGNENAIGQYFCLGYILNLYLGITRKNYPLIVTLPFFAIFGALTGSKLFLIMLILVTIAFIIMFFGRKKWYWSVIIITCTLAIIIGMLQLKMFSMLKERILDMIRLLVGSSSSIDMSTIIRYNMFFEGIYLFTFKPILGWGINGFAVNGAYLTYSHSTVSELLCDFGIVGFITFFFPIIMCIFAKKNKKFDILRIMLLVFILSTYMFAVAYGSKSYHITLAIICTITGESADVPNSKCVLQTGNAET